MQRYFPIVPMVILIIRFIVFAMLRERQVAKADSYTRVIPNPIKQRYKMKLNFVRRIKVTDPLFNGHFIEVKAFYVLQFDKVPCLYFIGNVDVTKIYAHMREVFNSEIVSVYQHMYFDHDEQTTFFNNSVFVLTQNRMIELGKGYVQILHTPEDYVWADNLMKALAEFRMDETPIQTQVVGFARQPAMN
jgi:hypothetical protein